jgi:hypothetical protein
MYKYRVEINRRYHTTAIQMEVLVSEQGIIYATSHLEAVCAKLRDAVGTMLCLDAGLLETTIETYSDGHFVKIFNPHEDIFDSLATQKQWTYFVRVKSIERMQNA